MPNRRWNARLKAGSESQPTDRPISRTVAVSRTSSLQAWLTSPERAALMAEADRLSASDLTVQRTSGLEAWFRLPGRRLVLPPPRYKIVLVTWLAILPLIELFTVVAAPLPVWLRPVPVTLVLVTLLTFVVMPALTRLLRRWLIGGPTHTVDGVCDGHAVCACRWVSRLAEPKRAP